MSADESGLGVQGESPRPRFRVEVDKEGLVDDYLAFVTDPRPARTEIHAAVLDAGPVPTAVLEQMVLDGVTERHDVEDLVTYVLETVYPTAVTSPSPTSDWVR